MTLHLHSIETPIAEQLFQNTERYVRDCLRRLGDHHDEDTIMRVTNKLALTMSVEIQKREAIIAMTEACFTPEEQERLKREGFF
jgi:hypothetical protein